MRSKRFPILLAACLCSAAPVLGGPPGEAQAVSPGGSGQYLTIGSPCPTFSWAANPGAEGYELVVYQVDEETGRVDTTTPALRVTVPGAATSWTPSAARCLAAGGRFSWAVRPTGAEGGWSTPRLFEVDAAPSGAALKLALRQVFDELIEEGRLTAADSRLLERRLGDTGAERRFDPDGPRTDSIAASTRALDLREQRLAEAAREGAGSELVPGETDSPAGDGAPDELGGADAAIGNFVALETAGAETVSLEALDDHGSGSNLILRNTSGERTAEMDSMDSSSQGGFLWLWAVDQVGSGVRRTILLDAQGTGASGSIQLWMQPSGGGSDHETVRIEATEGAGEGGSLKLYKIDGTVAIDLDAEIGGAGGDARITTEELSITGGSDLSEQFTMGGGPEPVPGSLVAIDPTGDGALRLTAEPYDPRIVGVVSGAGGLKTGMMMGQWGSPADGEIPVALAGRVYVLADASEGPIRPGDFLTSSALPGHAMRVTDQAQAQGAILGKAMTRLESGRGLVLVLVSLQ